MPVEHIVFTIAWDAEGRILTPRCECCALCTSACASSGGGPGRRGLCIIQMCLVVRQCGATLKVKGPAM